MKSIRANGRVIGVGVAALCVVGLIGFSVSGMKVLRVPLPHTSAKDRADVTRVINQHFLAIRQGDVKKLGEVWDTTNGRVQYLSKGKDRKMGVSSVPVSGAMKTWVSAKDAAANGYVMSVDVIDKKIATARVMFRWQGETFHEFLTLFKMNGKWLITNKAFTTVGKKRGGGSAYGSVGASAKPEPNVRHPLVPGKAKGDVRSKFSTTPFKDKKHHAPAPGLPGVPEGKSKVSGAKGS